MDDQNRIIKGLWIGNKLSPIEILCIKSYLQNGHEFHLYTYEPVKNVPEGTIIKDAGEIISHSEMLEIVSGISAHAYAIFSDIFRYKLLYETGGWWSDLDAICVKQFDFAEEYVFIKEKVKQREDRVNNAIIKTPLHTPIMDACYQRAMQKVSDLTNSPWYALGPILLNDAVMEFALESFAKPSNQFTPIGNFEIDKWLSPYNFGDEVYSAHVYNDIWSTRKISKYGIYAPDSLIRSLMIKYSVRLQPLGLLKELVNDLRKRGGWSTVKSKVWFMLQSFKNSRFAAESA